MLGTRFTIGMGLACCTVASAQAPMTTASRTAGVAPLAVHFDAVDTDEWQSGVIQPSDGDHASWFYEWDFGDPTAGRWVTTGRSRNRCTGFVAAHVYEQPGEYEVRLTLTTAAGERHVYTELISVRDYAGGVVYCDSSVAQSGSGLSPLDPVRTLPEAVGLLGTGTPPIRCLLLRRGLTYVAREPVLIDVDGPGIIGAYGAGLKPVIAGIVAPDEPVLAPRRSDWRFVDLAGVRRPANDDTVFFDIYTAAVQDVLALRLDVAGFDVAYANTEGGGSREVRQLALVDCTAHSPYTAGVYLGGDKLMVQGCDFRYVVASQVGRFWHATKAVLTNSRYDTPGHDRAALRVQNVVYSAWPETHHAYVAENHLVGRVTGLEVAPESHDLESGEARERLRACLIERNFVTGLSHPVIPVFEGLRLCGRDLTVRNNVVCYYLNDTCKYFYGCIIAHYDPLASGGTTVRLYNNTIARHQEFAEWREWFGVLVERTVAHADIRNNVFYTPDLTDVDLYTVTGPAANFVDADNRFTSYPGTFVDPGGCDFHLFSNTSLIGVPGTPLVIDDFDRVLRSTTGRIHPGAFESVPNVLP